MVSIKKRAKPDGTIFYYLDHSVRKGSKVEKRPYTWVKKYPGTLMSPKQNFSGRLTKTTMMTLKLSKETMLKK